MSHPASRSRSRRAGRARSLRRRDELARAEGLARRRASGASRRRRASSRRPAGHVVLPDAEGGVGRVIAALDPADPFAARPASPTRLARGHLPARARAGARGRSPRSPSRWGATDSPATRARKGRRRASPARRGRGCAFPPASTRPRSAASPRPWRSAATWSTRPPTTSGPTASRMRWSRSRRASTPTSRWSRARICSRAASR